MCNIKRQNCIYNGYKHTACWSAVRPAEKRSSNLPLTSEPLPPHPSRLLSAATCTRTLGSLITLCFLQPLAQCYCSLSNNSLQGKVAGGRAGERGWGRTWWIGRLKSNPAQARSMAMKHIHNVLYTCCSLHNSVIHLCSDSNAMQLPNKNASSSFYVTLQRSGILTGGSYTNLSGCSSGQ